VVDFWACDGVSALATTAFLTDDAFGTADQVTQVVWSWSGFISGSQTRTGSGPEWTSPSIGNIFYRGDPNGGGTFTVTATAYDKDGQSAVLTSQVVTVTECRLPWLDWAISPVGAKIAQAINGQVPCDDRSPIYVDASVAGRNGVVRVVFAWSGFISGQREAKPGEVVRLGPIRYTWEPNPGGTVRLTVVGYDSQGQKSNELATIITVLGCSQLG
jgi:hypothetical protein